MNMIIYLNKIMNEQINYMSINKFINYIKNQKNALQFIVCILMILFFFFPIIINPCLTFFSNYSDYFEYHYINQKNIKQSLSVFEKPKSWSNLYYGGQPWFANPQNYFFNPINLFLFIFTPETTTNLYLLILIIIGTIGYIKFLKLFKLSKLSIIFGLIIFLFNFKIISHIYAGHYGFYSYYLLPLCFYLLHKCFVSLHFKNLFALVFFLSISMFISHTQFFYYQFILLFFFYIYLIITKKILLNIKHIIFMLVGMLLFLLCCASLILPAGQLINHIFRSGGNTYNFTTMFSFKYTQLIKLFLQTVININI